MADSRIADFELFWLGHLVEGVIRASVGFGQLNEARPFPGREGVFHCCAEAFGFDEAIRCDVFFVTLKTSERLFSPTTRYNDYAICPWEFHWDSHSLTREASTTGQRYLHHRESDRWRSAGGCDIRSRQRSFR